MITISTNNVQLLLLRQYIKETTENPELETEILEVGDGLAITKKRLKNSYSSSMIE